MIKEWFPSLRKSRVIHGTVHHRQQHQHNVVPYEGDTKKAAEMGITVAEYRLRNDLIKTEAQKFWSSGFHIQQVVRPTLDEDYEQAGEVVVMGICQDLSHYGAVRWNDPPLILQVRSKKHDGYINCSVGWIKRLENVQC